MTSLKVKSNFKYANNTYATWKFAFFFKYKDIHVFLFKAEKGCEILVNMAPYLLDTKQKK